MRYIVDLGLDAPSIDTFDLARNIFRHSPLLQLTSEEGDESRRSGLQKATMALSGGSQPHSYSSVPPSAL